MIAKNKSDLLGKKFNDNNFETLTEIIIDDGVENIYDEAFSMHRYLKSVVLPNSIKSIGNNAFYACSNLLSIELPNSLLSIGNSAFRFCANLKSIYIPDNVQSIGTDILGGCDELKSIVVSKKNKNFDSRDDCNAIIRTSDNKLLFGCNLSTIPEGVASIDLGAFSCCYKVSTINIPKSLRHLSINTFPGRDEIKSIKVNEENKIFDSRNNCNAIIRSKNDSLIMGCNSTIIPSSIKKIDKYAFADCSKIENIILPDGVTSIGRSAFDGCTSLSYIKIPNSVKIIDKFAFRGCDFSHINIPGSVEELSDRIIYSCGNLKTVEFGDGITTIKDNTIFNPSNSIENIFLPNSVISIGKLFICPRSKDVNIIIPKGSLEKFKKLLPYYKKRLIEQ